MNKSILLSKTFYFGLLTAIAPLIPVLNDYIHSHMEVLVSAWGALTVILRYVTKDKVVLLPE